MFARKKTFVDRIKDLFGGSPDQMPFDDLEDALLEADVGPSLAVKLVDQLRLQIRQQNLTDFAAVRLALRDTIAGLVRVADLRPDSDSLHCYLFLGVNGVGKTTTLAKLARAFLTARPGTKIVLAAGDTFRAAATQQLELHGRRLGLRVVGQGPGADSAAVIYDAIDSARARQEQIVLADTAGRLHNKTHLVQELQKINKIVLSKLPAATYKKVLVLDATTGRNGLQQAEVFNRAVGVDGVIVTKFDSNAKAGMVLAIGNELGLGVAYLGTGEDYDSLEPFDPLRFADRLVGL